MIFVAKVVTLLVVILFLETGNGNDLDNNDVDGTFLVISLDGFTNNYDDNNVSLGVAVDIIIFLWEIK